jgi:vacuolar-type H+-ATPase subunit E/Vma4
MNDQPHMSALDTQVDALLQRVTRDRDQRCGQIRAAAEQQAREIVRSGRADARARVRNAVVQERARIAEGLRQAEAHAELEARQQAQRETHSLLEYMWTQIAGVLEERWGDPLHRGTWLQAALRQAALLLDSGSWRIEYRPELTAAERSELEQRVGTDPPRKIEWVCEPAIQPGVRIRCEGVCLDATIPGLLAHRTDIEAAFLAEYAAAVGESLPT